MVSGGSADVVGTLLTSYGDGGRCGGCDTTAMLPVIYEQVMVEK